MSLLPGGKLSVQAISSTVVSWVRRPSRIDRNPADLWSADREDSKITQPPVNLRQCAIHFGVRRTYHRTSGPDLRRFAKRATGSDCHIKFIWPITNPSNPSPHRRNIPLVSVSVISTKNLRSKHIQTRSAGAPPPNPRPTPNERKHNLKQQSMWLYKLS